MCSITLSKVDEDAKVDEEDNDEDWDEEVKEEQEDFVARDKTREVGSTPRQWAEGKTAEKKSAQHEAVVQTSAEEANMYMCVYV
ncbi:hypothetical protein BG004_005263 [Podila humilis]|nr:hypothetical protein BG004_005263 [Podila humilis]